MDMPFINHVEAICTEQILLKHGRCLVVMRG